MWKSIFTEDFENRKFYNEDREITGLTFSSERITPTVFPPLGQKQNATALLKSLCCSACAYVHGQLGISYANCICCFYIGGYGFSCYLEV